jgi:hypothetical protein
VRSSSAALALCLAVGGCARTPATDPCAEALAGTQIDGTYEVEGVGVLSDSSAVEGFVFGWVAEGHSDSLVRGAAVYADSAMVGTHTDSLGSFRLSLPPGRHRLAVSYVGFDVLNVPVEVESGQAVEVRARLGTFVPGVDVCVSSSDLWRSAAR